MSDMNKSTLVAVVAVAVAAFGLLAASGFQGGTEKFAVVDMNAVMNNSKRGQDTKTFLQADYRQRTGVLEFLSTNDVATEDQAQKLSQLSLKANPTDADKAAVEALKDEIKKAGKDFNDLNLKSNPTADDRTKLEALNARRNALKEKIIPELQKQFDDDFNKLNHDKQGELLDAAKAAVKEVASKKGFTVVFESSVVMFAANDLTDDAIKAMNAKN